MKRFLFLIPWLLLAGCAASGEEPKVTSSSSGPHAECLVCKHNADLACIDVAVEKDTPRYDYDGKTYYFCSEDCRQKFAKNPEKYVKNR